MRPPEFCELTDFREPKELSWDVSGSIPEMREDSLNFLGVEFSEEELVDSLKETIRVEPLTEGLGHNLPFSVKHCINLGKL